MGMTDTYVARVSCFSLTIISMITNKDELAIQYPDKKQSNFSDLLPVLMMNLE